MKTILLSFFSLLFFVAACTTKDDSTKKLQDEVIAIHDEVMPLMGAFVHNSLAIDSILNNFDKIKATHPELDTVQQRESLTSLKNSIDDATDAMNGWMHELDLDFENKTKEEVEKYLQDEKTKVEGINTRFKEIAKKSEETLSPYKK